MKKHTKETCFRLVGYPDWWEKPGQRGRAAVAVREQVVGDKVAAPMTSTAAAAVGGLESGDKPTTSSSGGFGGIDGTGHSYEGNNWAWY
ncbi:hypothetical protein Hdeb2414_s0015g00449241 [Helianthus debilis subsp. tardiflorus]